MVDEQLIASANNAPSLKAYLMEEHAHKRPIPAANKMVVNDADMDRIIQMAWEDRTPFEAIEFQFGLKEKEVIEFMRKNSLPSSFRMWRKRMKSRKTKHLALRDSDTNRFKCSRQKGTGNKISKR